jgi:phosphoglucosamine mutase
MAAVFGTDGVRGRANVELTPELAVQLGRALVAVLSDSGDKRPSVVVGRDPRWSGEMLESALVAGVTSAGGDAVCVGVLPTPAVAYLTTRSSAAAGAMISASHNPVGDNGIKFFGADGYKLTDAAEQQIVALLDQNDGPRPLGTRIGRRLTDPAAVSRYIDHVVAATAVDLGGMRLVVDGANGAAFNVAPQVYRQLGADVVAIHCAPDGANINADCGSTYPAVIAAATRENGCDVGISHDGDADRLIAATHDGADVDGDVILAILARYAKARGALKHDTVVTTVMTNLGFKQAMDRLGIAVRETPVGDRYVLEEMRANDLTLGGEQSGHIIDRDFSTTGDGVLSAVRLLSVMKETGASLAELATVMTRLPQVLINVADVDRERLDDATAVWDLVARESERLGDQGRVLLRASGTERVIRVMVEAATSADATDTANRIAASVTRELGMA